jgi:transketolase
MTLVQPGCDQETRAVVAWAIGEAEESVGIRLAIGPSPRRIELPEDWRLERGRGTVLVEGGDALLLAYGPVMLHEALVAAETLRAEGTRLCVVDLPWLNRFDREWLSETVASFAEIFVLEDHAGVGGLGDALVRELSRQGLLDGRTVTVFGVDGWPACGAPPEVLRFHSLDGASLARRIGSVARVR